MSWLPALRIARRDALRAKGRSVLIVAMVALPVLGIGAVDLLWRSAQLDPHERLARDLGRAQAQLMFLGGGSVLQAPDPRAGGATAIADTGSGSARPPKLPAGYRFLISREGTLTFRTAGGVAAIHVQEIALDDPVFGGKFDLLDGRAPRTAHEVALTRQALARFGVDVGGTVELLDPKRSLRVVGAVEQVGGRGRETVWARPGSLLARGAASDEAPPVVYLTGGRPVTWDDVLRLNGAGLVVLSRAVVLDPPPRSEVPYFTRGFEIGQHQDVLATVLGVTLVVTLALLEVVLLAGAAFAVGARRQARSLGLVAAAGGEPRDIRRIVLASGAVLGLAGAFLGVALALASAAAAMPLLERYADQDFGHYDLRPLELAGAFSVGLLAAILAATLPARGAARRDPVEALTGRRGQVRTPRKAPSIGIALIGLGIAAASTGSILAVSSAAGVNPAGGRASLLAAALIAGGAAVTQLGLIVCSPAIVGLAGRFSRGLPLPLRLALTDAARHRGRSAPAVAAVLAAVTGATAVAVVAASFDARDRDNYRAAWPPATAGIQLDEIVTTPSGQTTTRLLDPARVVSAVGGELPPFQPSEIRSVPPCTAPAGCEYVTPVLPPGRACPLSGPQTPTDAERAAAKSDPRCNLAGGYQGGVLPTTPVGDARLLRLLADRASAQATDALAADGVVVFDPRYVVDGRITFERTSPAGSRTTRLRLPAVVSKVTNPPVLALLGEGAAKRLGLRTAPTHLLLSFDRLPTTEQEDAAREALMAVGIQNPFTVERGYAGDYGLGLLALVVGAALITLGAAGIATGLAQADARADHATLAAVGATPGLRRTLAAAQAVSIAGLGTLLGVLGGLVPSLAFIGAIDGLEVALPWMTLVQVLVGIPLLAGVSAWLLTRSRLPLERRVAV